MFKALKISLMFAFVFQASMMPVSKALAAQHTQAYSRISSTVYVSGTIVITEVQPIGKAGEWDSLSDKACFLFPLQKMQLQRGCDKKIMKDGRGDGYLSAPIIDASVSASVTLILALTRHYRVQSGYPLYSVVIAPPFRPPTS